MDGSVFRKIIISRMIFDIGSCVACRTEYGCTKVVLRRMLRSVSHGNMVEH